MQHDDDRSYEQYKQYRRNRYRYAKEQIVFPITIIIGLAILICLWKYILIAVVSIAVLALVVTAVYLYLRKQLKSDRDVVISKADAKEGIEAKINVSYNSQIVTFSFHIPSNVTDGQNFVAKNILFKNKNGKNIKKNVHFIVRVR